MKKSILMLALALGTFATNSFAADSKKPAENPGVNSFAKDFASAKDATWENHSKFLKVSFKEDGQFLFAYYSNNGELIAVTRNLAPTQLSISSYRQLRTNYSGYWITELFEVNAGQDTTYYVTLENGSQKITLKALENNAWEVYQSEAK